jgi:hypothetical protein
MRGSRKVKILSVVVVVLIIFGTSFLLIIPPDAEYLLNFGGYYYVSDIQGPNSNISYSIIFHEVNFTFLYWYWPKFVVMNNITAFVAEQTVHVHVLIRFSDGSSELLIAYVDSPGSCLIGIDSTLHGVTSNHSNPQAGIASAETEELHSNWVYVVSAI